MATLAVYFQTRDEYTRAKAHFNNDSDFYADEESDEFRRLGFSEDCDLDQLEYCICDELTNAGFETFYFAAE